MAANRRSRVTTVDAPPTESVAAGRRGSLIDQMVRSGVPAWVWWALLGLLSGWVAYRLGAFHLWDTVVAEDGRQVRLPASFTTIDHPFHIARAETLRQELTNWQPLRWVGNHQGGYPVEFYPLGVAWLEVGVWALFLGLLPMAAVHKLSVIAIFLVPGVAFALMARRDGRPVGVGLLALAIHVAVPGEWWSGGYTELVLWGLVTNVAAATALLFTLLWLTSFLAHGGQVAVVGAVLTGAFAISTNPRSLIALAVIGAGAWLAVAARSDTELGDRWTATRRLGLAAAATALLAAPELVALLRFEHLYYFVRYEWYSDLGEYFQSSVRAVSLPILLMGIAGVALGLSLAGRVVTRAVALTLVLYVGVTALLTTGSSDAPLIQQLETTRLMPFQRFLTIYLAAVAFHLGVRWIARAAGRPSLADLLKIGAAVALLVVFVAPIRDVPELYHGLYEVQTSATPELASFNDAIDVADAEAAPGTVILVVGSVVSWHQQLWAPLRSERPFFYDNWLWYWHTRHDGPYDYRQGHHYPQPEAALTRDYFDTHGVGAVVVADTPASPTGKLTASRSPDLELVREGLYNVYLVREPTPIVSFPNGDRAVVQLGNQRLQAHGVSNGGEVLIRHNWYPRWAATVNGESQPITRTDDGYMTVPVPPGEVTVSLTYGVDAWDWLARLASIAGFAVMVGYGVLRRVAKSRRGPHPQPLPQ